MLCIYEVSKSSWKIAGVFKSFRIIGTNQCAYFEIVCVGNSLSSMFLKFLGNLQATFWRTIWKFRASPWLWGIIIIKSHGEREAAVTFNQRARRGKKMKALCVSAGGRMACSWQSDRLPNQLFLIYLVSGEFEMLGSSRRSSACSAYFCVCQSPQKGAHLLPNKCNIEFSWAG